jgi:internalin A
MMFKQYRKQPVVGLQMSIALICCAILALSGNALSAKAAEVRSQNKTFADWCREKDSLSSEAKHTVDRSCKPAN